MNLQKLLSQKKAIKFKDLTLLEIFYFFFFTLILGAAVYYLTPLFFFFLLEKTESLFFTLLLAFSAVTLQVIILSAEYLFVSIYFWFIHIYFLYVSASIAEEFSTAIEKPLEFTYNLFGLVIKSHYVESVGLWYLIFLLFLVVCLISSINILTSTHKYFKIIHVFLFVIIITILAWTAELQLIISNA